METLFTIVGISGAGMCILAYFLIEQEKLNASSMAYYAMNGIGAVLILLAAVYRFDSGDFGVAVQELCWIAVSLMGITKVLKKKSKA
jgi:multidrug transporter EmrE-like cation transporter